MKKLTLVSLALTFAMALQAQWKPAGDKIKTSWGESVNPQNVLPEYPRPQLQRGSWQNLNGLWSYAIKPAGQAAPETFDGKILVPFCVESSLSGVMKEVGSGKELWYQRQFTVPSGWRGCDVLLHFGAVDWKADVFVNSVLIGSHTGGYTPFTMNITPYISKSGRQTLTVRVFDPTDEGEQPIGKQRVKPEGIWYTPVTGIWQTVWIEPVSPANHIESIKAIPDIDNKTLSVTVMTEREQEGDIVRVKLLDNGREVAEGKAAQGQTTRITVKDMRLWSTDDPYLYDMKVTLSRGGKVIDEVKSYTAFRKVSAERGADGHMRICLNGKPLFNYGPLDQGWWPDGLYTAPSDEALRYDIVKTKQWGFNMIRKHIKVEPARWYYHCDREGMLVWQDMPSRSTGGNSWEPRVYNGGTDVNRSAESVRTYYKELKEMMDFGISFPSIIVWVPFNEAWAQFDTEKVAAWVKDYDPSRLVNPASGGNHRACGDILDLHIYPSPELYLSDPARVMVIGEYGGIGLPVEGHLWRGNDNWGYVQFKSAADVTREYVKYAAEMQKLVRQGVSAAVYTQTTDVEGEVNGLMTYDRKVVKVDEKEVRDANQKVINMMSK